MKKKKGKGSQRFDFSQGHVTKNQPMEVPV